MMNKTLENVLKSPRASKFQLLLFPTTGWSWTRTSPIHVTPKREQLHRVLRRFWWQTKALRKEERVNPDHEDGWLCWRPWRLQICISYCLFMSLLHLFSLFSLFFFSIPLCPLCLSVFHAFPILGKMELDERRNWKCFLCGSDVRRHIHCIFLLETRLNLTLCSHEYICPHCFSHILDAPWPGGVFGHGLLNLELPSAALCVRCGLPN